MRIVPKSLNETKTEHQHLSETFRYLYTWNKPLVLGV